MSIDITKVLRQENTVFSIKDLSIIWQETNYDLLKSKVNYYVKTGQLIRLRRGIYAKDQNYERFELACKIFKPAYISLNTVMAREGINFQYYESIYLVSYLRRELKIDSCDYLFFKIKDSVLSNMQGIINKDGYSIASKERAFLDRLYLFGETHYDNLHPLDWDLCYQLVSIYEQKSLVKSLDSYYQIFKEEYIA